MKFREFVGAAEVHLRMTGWLMHGHNGVWRKYKKGGDSESKPFPAALRDELARDSVFHPSVELYLTDNGWRRSTGVIAGWPLFQRGGKYKNMLVALLEQLRDDRMDRAAVAPRTTPSELKQLLAPSSSRPSTSGYADTARARTQR